MKILLKILVSLSKTHPDGFLAISRSMRFFAKIPKNPLKWTCLSHFIYPTPLLLSPQNYELLNGDKKTQFPIRFSTNWKAKLLMLRKPSDIRFSAFLFSFLTSPVFCCDYLSDILKNNKLLYLVGAVICNVKAIKWPPLRTTWITHTLTWAANFTRILWHGLNRICSSRNLRNFLKPGWATPVFKPLS